MHSALLVFHYEDSDVENMLIPHNYNCNENNEFVVQYYKGVEVKTQYNIAIKNDPKKYNGMSVDDVVADWTGYSKDKDGNFGYMTNPIGFFDWCEIGGRFEISFPLKNKAVAKELVNEALEDKSEWRNRIHEWAKLKAMNSIDACNQLGLVKNTAFIKDVDWEKAKKEEGGLCAEILCQGNMPVKYTEKELDNTVKEWLKIKGAKVTMVDYHS